MNRSGRLYCRRRRRLNMLLIARCLQFTINIVAGVRPAYINLWLVVIRYFVPSCLSMDLLLSGLRTVSLLNSESFECGNWQHVYLSFFGCSSHFFLLCMD
jgi:hypothetical protein